MEVTSDPDRIRRADRIVLPGVGAFADCRRGLDAVPGLLAAMTEAVILRGRPFLGICVGMQLMASRGLEHEVTEGLGWIEGDVGRPGALRSRPEDPAYGLEHPVSTRRAHPLLDGIASGETGLHAYFVHSYAHDAAA